MLNELCKLADSLEKAGISPKEWHHELKPLPNSSDKKPCYRICISENGSVSSVDTLNHELVATLRKWEPSLGNSFPGLNIQPLFRITDKEQQLIIKKWLEGKEIVNVELLKSWCSCENENWDDKINSKLQKCICELPLNLLKLLSDRVNNKYDTIRVLLTRVVLFPFPRKKVDSNIMLYDISFRNALEEYIWKGISEGIEIKSLLPVLIHQGDIKKKASNDRGALSIFIDILDWKEFPVASKETIDVINELLVDSSQMSDITTVVNDAFGLSLLGSDDKLPSVKLPMVADVKLRAMNGESKCQSRYGTIDASSFPIGAETRKRAKGALEWLSSASREGETWGRADTKELIFAYPETLNEKPVKLVSMFGARKEEDASARFANAAQDTIKSLKGLSQKLNTLDIRVFSLKKMDKARTKVMFHRNYSAQRLAEAAEQWETGCNNISEIIFKTWDLEKKTIAFISPETPFPLQISLCINRVWNLDGTSQSETPILSPSHGIYLLLESDSHRSIPHFLSALLKNSSGLFLSLGNMLHQGEIISIKGFEKQKLLLPSILGLFLYKLGIKKENYMNDAPFLVGRMLKLADELHALYCKEVRKNNLPPQLIGNSLMTAALDSPVQALAQLALRLKPYYGWAQTFPRGESNNLSGYFLYLYGEVSSQLSHLTLPNRLNDAERAQLLLGYLAANPKKNEKYEEKTLSENN